MEENKTENWEDWDEIEEIEKPNLVSKIIKITLALLLLVSFLYFSGLRQYFFFSITSPNIEIDYIGQVLNYEVVDLPVKVILVREELFGSRRNQEEVESLLKNASRILNQAGIHLDRGSTIEKEMTEEEVKEIINGNLSSLEILNQKKINLVLVRVLRGINGVAYPGINTTVIPDYTAGRDFRVLGHEVGHILGLGHQESQEYLMSQGATGNLLKEEEVIIMRQTLDEKFSK